MLIYSTFYLSLRSNYLQNIKDPTSLNFPNKSIVSTNSSYVIFLNFLNILFSINLPKFLGMKDHSENVELAIFKISRQNLISIIILELSKVFTYFSKN